MQTPKARTGSSEGLVPQKVSPRGMRQLRPSALYIDSVSTAHRTSSKDRSPKVIERRSPRSPAPERKRPSRIPELESQISQLREDLKKLREQLSLSESCKKQAQKEAKESKEQIFALSSKLEESQRKLLKISAISDEVREHERAWKSIAIAESSELEILNLKQNLSESVCLVENLKNQLMDCKDSSQAQDLVNETLRQLEAAKRTVEHLRADAAKSVNGHNSASIQSAETKYQEEQIRSVAQITNAFELMEKIKLESSKRESEIAAELKIKRAEIEELKGNLLDKETELQGIVEENEKLNLEIEKNLSSQREIEQEFKREIERLNECVAELKAEMMDKETTLQSITAENEMLKMEINKRPSDIEAAKAAEHEAVVKLMVVMEEADRSEGNAARMAEQLEAAHATNSELEAELRRVKVQSDQWRKAAEAAAAVLSAGKGKISERSLSLDNSYNNKPVMMNKYSNYCDDIIDDYDDDLQRKKNGNMLKKIGVLWKKPQK